jgi:hypothetical protein
VIEEESIKLKVELEESQIFTKYSINRMQRRQRNIELGIISTQEAKESEQEIKFNETKTELEKNYERKLDIEIVKKKIELVKLNEQSLEKEEAKLKEKFEEKNLVLEAKINEMSDELKESEERNSKLTEEVKEQLQLIEKLQENINNYAKSKLDMISDNALVVSLNIIKINIYSQNWK